MEKATHFSGSWNASGTVSSEWVTAFVERQYRQHGREPTVVHAHVIEKLTKCFPTKAEYEAQQERTRERNHPDTFKARLVALELFFLGAIQDNVVGLKTRLVHLLELVGQPSENVLGIDMIWALEKISKAIMEKVPDDAEVRAGELTCIVAVGLLQTEAANILKE